MRILTQDAKFELIVKKSRFEVKAVKVDSPEDALKKLILLSDLKANHNCWAYKIGDQFRSSDDGEPGGSAGRPILAAIEAQNIDQVLVVVTRFFGGIKLGVGGLVRAYGGSAAECLRTAESEEVIPISSIKFAISFELMGSVFSLLEKLAIERNSENYIETGVELEIALPTDQVESLTKSLTDLTRGKVVFLS